jgi:hypothetical protein
MIMKKISLISSLVALSSMSIFAADKPLLPAAAAASFSCAPAAQPAPAAAAAAALAVASSPAVRLALPAASAKQDDAVTQAALRLLRDKPLTDNPRATTLLTALLDLDSREQEPGRPRSASEEEALIVLRTELLQTITDEQYALRVCSSPRAASKRAEAQKEKDERAIKLTMAAITRPDVGQGFEGFMNAMMQNPHVNRLLNAVQLASHNATSHS